MENPRDVLYGRLPHFGLSKTGREQVEAAAGALASEQIAVLYTSPRLRARQTARALAGACGGTQVRVSRLLDEVKTGWQGRPHSELEKIRFDFYAHPIDPEDETLEAVWARLERFVSRARRDYPGQTVAAVTHGDLCFLARSVYSGLPLSIDSIRLPYIYPGKGSLTRLTFPADLSRKTRLRVEYRDPSGETAPPGCWAEYLQGVAGPCNSGTAFEG